MLNLIDKLNEKNLFEIRKKKNYVMFSLIYVFYVKERSYDYFL